MKCSTTDVRLPSWKITFFSGPPLKGRRERGNGEGEDGNGCILAVQLEQCNRCITCLGIKSEGAKHTMCPLNFKVGGPRPPSSYSPGGCRTTDATGELSRSLGAVVYTEAESAKNRHYAVDEESKRSEYSKSKCRNLSLYNTAALFIIRMKCHNVASFNCNC